MSLNPMDKHATQVMKGNKIVGHLPCEFSQKARYFLSAEISVEVIHQRIFLYTEGFKCL